MSTETGYFHTTGITVNNGTLAAGIGTLAAGIGTLAAGIGTLSAAKGTLAAGVSGRGADAPSYLVVNHIIKT